MVIAPSKKSRIPTLRKFLVDSVQRMYGGEYAQTFTGLLANTHNPEDAAYLISDLNIILDELPVKRTLLPEEISVAVQEVYDVNYLSGAPRGPLPYKGSRPVNEVLEQKLKLYRKQLIQAQPGYPAVVFTDAGSFSETIDLDQKLMWYILH